MRRYLHKKLPVREDGAFGQLPLYVRGLASMILKYCDADGSFAIGKRTAAEAVARRCGAEPNERRRLARDIQTLIDVGYLRLEEEALVIADQATQITNKMERSK